MEPAPGPGEQLLSLDGVTLFLGAESRLLLNGVTIDFADTKLQTGFVFHDPKQVTCGRAPTLLTTLSSDVAAAG